MTRSFLCISAASLSLALAAPAVVMAEPPAPAPALETAPPAPDFKAGAALIDRTGARIGTIESLTEGDRDMVLVARIDGKLVSIPEGEVKLVGGNAVSTRTKAEILAAAGAPN